MPELSDSIIDSNGEIATKGIMTVQASLTDDKQFIILLLIPQDTQGQKIEIRLPVIGMKALLNQPGV